MLCIGLISGRYIPSVIGCEHFECISNGVMFHHSLHFAILVLLLAYFLPENPYVAHALEPVINLLHGAGFVSSSTDTLMKNHLFMPTLKQFIYGDGMYMTGQLEVGRYYGHTGFRFLTSDSLWWRILCFSVFCRDILFCA